MINRTSSLSVQVDSVTGVLEGRESYSFGLLALGGVLLRLDRRALDDARRSIFRNPRQPSG